MEMVKEKKARLEKTVATTELMLALIKGVVSSFKPILKRPCCERVRAMDYCTTHYCYLKCNLMKVRRSDHFEKVTSFYNIKLVTAWCMCISRKF